MICLQKLPLFAALVVSVPLYKYLFGSEIYKEHFVSWIKCVIVTVSPIRLVFRGSRLLINDRRPYNIESTLY